MVSAKLVVSANVALHSECSLSFVHRYTGLGLLIIMNTELPEDLV